LKPKVKMNIPRLDGEKNNCLNLIISHADNADNADG